MARDFGVSKEAMARAFVDAHREPVAIILSRNGKVVRIYRHDDFPFLEIAPGKPLPSDCMSEGSLGAGEFKRRQCRLRAQSNSRLRFAFFGPLRLSLES
jgi:hypothetical protein